MEKQLPLFYPTESLKPEENPYAHWTYEACRLNYQDQARSHAGYWSPEYKSFEEVDAYRHANSNERKSIGY